MRKRKGASGGTSSADEKDATKDADPSGKNKAKKPVDIDEDIEYLIPPDRDAHWFHWKDLSIVFFLAVLGLACATRYYQISHPSEIVFDETHFGLFSNHYLKREFFFDIHPPLGKLLLALVASFKKDYKADFPFGDGKQPYHKHESVPYTWMRSTTATFNVIAIVAMYFTSRLMGMSLPVSFLTAALVIFEHGMMVQCRLVLIDSFLITFLCLAMCASFYFARFGPDKTKPIFTRKYWIWAFITGFTAGCSASVKWTGLTIVAGAMVHQAAISFMCMRITGKKKYRLDMIVRPLAVLGAAAFAYFLVQVAHFWVLSNNGPGSGFMSEEFKASLGRYNPAPNAPKVTPKGFFGKMIELTKFMFVTNEAMTQSHPYQSAWWGWPVNRGGMFYWHLEGSAPRDGQPTKAEILMFGNTWIYRGTLAGFALFVVVAVVKTIIEVPFHRQTIFFLVTGVVFIIQYVGNLLPYIGIRRSTYLYHYFPGLVSAIFLSTLTVESALRPVPKIRALVAFALAAGAGYMFWFQRPFAYGWPITEPERWPRMGPYYWIGGPDDQKSD